MEWNEDIDLSRRKMSSQLIVRRALARGWKICGFVTNPAVFLLYIPGRQTPVKIFSASPSQMSYPATKFAKDKFITNALLAAEGLPVPAEQLVRSSDIDMDRLRQFLRDHGRLVVKPLDASHGKGITTDVCTDGMLETSLQEALQVSTNGFAIVQEQVGGVDVRVTCLNYQFLNSISRIPASVTGDGIHTVRELIDLTNASPERGENYVARLNVIPADKAVAYLGEAIGNVPAEGEAVQVIGVSNVGMGGERVNIRDDVPDVLKELAAHAARVMELPVCGVDFMVDHTPGPDDTLQTLRPKIIEVNECPMLTMYEDLDSPDQFAVIDAYLDYVATY